MNEQNNEKYSSRISEFIIKWSGLLLCVFSYGLILGLASAGLGLMVFSVLFGLFFDSGLFSGFGFLTGGMIFTSGGIMLLLKVTRELETLYQGLKKSEAS